MLPEMLPTRTAVWNLMCDLEMNVRYYGTKADQMRSRFIAIRFALLTSVVLEGFLLYWGTTAPWALAFAIAFGMVMAALALWDALANYAETAAVLRSVASGCDDLRFESERLWRDIQAWRVTRDEAEAGYARIYERWSRVAGKVTLQDDVNLCEQCSEDSNAVIRSRYAE